jgi:hypothetical protein
MDGGSPKSDPPPLGSRLRAAPARQVCAAGLMQHVIGHCGPRVGTPLRLAGEDATPECATVYGVVYRKAKVGGRVTDDGDHAEARNSSAALLWMEGQAHSF